MPFTKRSIEPVTIRRGTLDRVDVGIGEEHEAVVNGSYSQILLQLSQLATYANELFTDLSLECKIVIEKTQQLKTRIWILDQKAQELNVLDTPLPESSLEQVASEVRDAEVAQPIQSTGLFTAASRPDCVQRLYDGADVTPRARFVALGPVGYKAAKNFCLTPVLLSAGPTVVKLDTREVRHDYKIVYERKDKIRPIRPRPKPTAAAIRPQSCSAALFHSSDTLPALSRRSLYGGSGSASLPTPEELVLKNAKSHPSVLISIDTTSNNFSRFAQNRASLRNLQRSQDELKLTDGGLITRHDPRRKTISGPADLRSAARRHDSVTAEDSIMADMLLSKTSLSSHSKPKNPDEYLDDTAELHAAPSPLRSSQMKDRTTSVISRLVRRSKSLPRSMPRSKTRETIVAPDFYDIHPKKVTTIDSGIIVTDSNERLYANFYGAPNTEQPSPELQSRLVKSKSDHQIRKSISMMEDIKSRVQQSGRRHRSLSADRAASRTSSAPPPTEDRSSYNSLSRAFTGLFGKGKRSKSVQQSFRMAQSKDSINTIITTSSDGVETARLKRLSTAGTTSSAAASHVTYRKRDSKATTSSSGRWSGSERFSTDSDGLFSSASQLRLSRHSGDSAIGADISDKRPAAADILQSADGQTDQTDRRSLYSVDQDGFYTSMHSECQLLYEQQQTRGSAYDDAADDCCRTLDDDSLPNLSLHTSSSTASTPTLNVTEEKTTPDSHDSSVGSYPDNTEEITQRVLDKVNAGKTINRYSLVAMDSVEDESENSSYSPGRTTPKLNLKQCQTYESELDLVLEEISDCDTMTLHSDTESVLSLRCVKDTKPPVTEHSKHESTTHTTCKQPSASGSNMTPVSKKSGDVMPACKVVSNLSQHNLLPTVRQATTTVNDMRACKSLPRNVRKVVSREAWNQQLDNMGSWPRKLTLSEAAASVMTDNEELSHHDVQCTNSKRRSLSPGKLKSLSAAATSTTPDSDNKRIRSLIAEARRLSSTTITAPTPRPRSLLVNSTKLSAAPHDNSPSSKYKDDVSPYASVNVIDSPPSGESFIRQASYKKACSSNVMASPVRMYVPRSRSDGQMRRHLSSQRPSTSINSHQLSNCIAEVQDGDSADVDYVGNHVRAPSYRLAQSQSFDRASRAPSYRKALEYIPRSQRDSGFGSADLTSSSDSSGPEAKQTGNRVSSYRLATESAEPSALHHSVIKDCMKGVYENEERHLTVPKLIIGTPEVIQITDRCSQHYSTPKIPAKPTSFNPSGANSQPLASRQTLKQSVSAPPTDETQRQDMRLERRLLDNNHRKARPTSSYIPTTDSEREYNDVMVPENKLMQPAYNKSNFTSIEMLKRDEMAVISILGKIRQTTRPLSFVHTTDI